MIMNDIENFNLKNNQAIIKFYKLTVFVTDIMYTNTFENIKPFLNFIFDTELNFD